MSKLMGKKIFQNSSRGSGECVIDKLFVRYLKSNDAFKFRGYRAELGIVDSIVLSRKTVLGLIAADKVDAVVCRWAYGYKGKIYEDDMNKLMKKEMHYVGGDICIDEYLDFSLWQYMFNISKTLLDECVKAWKRRKWGNSDLCWIQCKQTTRNTGRVKGRGRGRGRGLDHVGGAGFDSETYLWNKKIAVMRKDLNTFLAGEKERCKNEGEKWNRKKYIKIFEQLCA